MELQANVSSHTVLGSIMLTTPLYRVSVTGSSEYRLGDKIVTYQVYNNALEKHNILVKAKNFLVFQGDVEAIASQSPIYNLRVSFRLHSSPPFDFLFVPSFNSSFPDYGNQQVGVFGVDTTHSP